MAFLNWSLSVRMAILFVIGLFVGSAVNWAVYRLAWNQRAIGPWAPRLPTAKPRGWLDWLPVAGWLGMRRDWALHGAGFWIRPMLLELAVAVGFVAIYWWETVAGGLLPVPARFLVGVAPMPTVVHYECFAHLLLFSLMMAATWIDIDEKTIPDEITFWGTLMGVALITWLPSALLPDVQILPDGPPQFSMVWLFSPLPIKARLAMPAVGHKGLALALACLWLWVFAMLPRTWYTRHGRVRAVRLMVARLIRVPKHYFLIPWSYFVMLLGVAATAVVIYFWQLGGVRWVALLSSLVGLGLGVALVWIVRVMGKFALQREAMGFGDVTLMAMIGSFLGWQAVVLIFFLAPFVGIVVGLAQFIWRGEVEIAYGPFLCIAALVTILGWPTVWDFTYNYFTLGWLLPLFLAVCLSLMVFLLPLVRWCLDFFRHDEEGNLEENE